MPPVHKRLYANPNRPNNQAVLQANPGGPQSARPQSENQGGGSGTFQGGGGGGGQSQYLGQFSATAYGPPWNSMQGYGVTADGTDLRPAKQVYGVAVDPKVIPMGTYLHINPNPFNYNGTFKAFDTGGAIKGRRIDFYDWRGRTKQQGWGVKNVQVYKATDPSSRMTPPSTGGGVNIPNPLSVVTGAVDVVDDAATAIVEFLRIVLSPKALGEFISKAVAYTLKLVFKAIWDFVIAPIVHWHQRAVMYYWEKTLLSRGDSGADSILDQPGVKGFVTFSFWATGYAIFWAKVDKERSLSTDPHRTALGSLIRGFGNTRARGRLVKPKDVKKKTPQKPTPQESSVNIVEQRRVAAERPRQVKVSGHRDDSQVTETADVVTPESEGNA